MTAVRVTRVPDTIPLADSNFLYNRSCGFTRADSDLMRATAQLNLANRADASRKLRSGIRTIEAVALPGGRGVSAATVDYMMVFCLRDIGQIQEAQEAFRRDGGCG